MPALTPHPPKPRPAPPSALLPLGDALSFLRVLWAVTHGLESRSKRMLATLGVTGPQRLVLRLVGHQGRISAGQLAEALHVHPSSLTGLLKRLEDAGLLRRESDPRDGRRALFELTPAGLKLNRQRRGTIEAAVESTLARQTAVSVATTKALLSALARTLDSAPREARSKRHPQSSAKSARTSR